MTKEALITNVSCNLQKQAGIAYAIGIENVRIPFYQVPSDFFCEEYTTLWRKHNTALFRSLQLYVIIAAFSVRDSASHRCACPLSVGVRR